MEQKECLARPYARMAANVGCPERFLPLKDSRQPFR